MIEIQVTVISTAGYRPLSTIIKVPDTDTFIAHKQDYVTKAMISIFKKRNMTIQDVRKYGYTGYKTRLYDKEKIAAENAARYERIKKERGWV